MNNWPILKSRETMVSLMEVRWEYAISRGVAERVFDS